MTDKAIANNPKAMGRPPLGIISTTVRLPKTTLERIDSLLGENRRAQFIRDAADAELTRRSAPAPIEVVTGLAPKPLKPPSGGSAVQPPPAQRLSVKVEPAIHVDVPVYKPKPFNPQPKTGKAKR